MDVPVFWATFLLDKASRLGGGGTSEEMRYGHDVGFDSATC